MGEKISVAEITKHSSAEDCWIVVNGKVYDLTKFAPEHPGGPEMIWKWAGKDGTETYNTYHSAKLIEETLSPCEKLGDLDESTLTEPWTKEPEPASAPSDSDPNEKPPLSTLINLEDFERAFEKSGSRKAWAYIWGASNDHLSLNANKSAWQKLWFRPRILRNVANITTETQILGCKARIPVWICPMGIAKTAGREGETALGAGAAAAGILHCMATTASMSMEEILASVPAEYPCFFQLYVDKQRRKTEGMLRKVRGLGQIRAVFVTVDLPVVSKREADERVLVRETMTTESVYATATGMKAGVDRKGGGLARSTGSFIDWALTWDDIAWIKKLSGKAVVVKGIQSSADAKIAMEMGCEGIVVSNHGGRALDSSPATLLVLLELRRDCPEVFERMEVFIDGGVRRGSDILKAICIGARGVGVGRPFQCAVMYDREGVKHAADVLQDELETAMRLCGVTDLEKARGDLSYLNTTELEQLLPPRPPGNSWFSFGNRTSKL